MATATKMTKNMERALDYIRYNVRIARDKSFEEWLTDFGYTLDTNGVEYLHEGYIDNKNGIVHCLIDGRVLNGLERRGFIRYYDDMERDDWCVVLLDD